MTTKTSHSKAGAAKAFIESGVATRGTNPAEELQRRVAEAAYYRAEKRNFVSGYELIDWLEAEQEIQQGIT